MRFKFDDSNINSCFRLYQSGDSNIKSTFFDLIDGTNETKQTKGMAYILSNNQRFLQEILGLPQINEKIRSILGKEYNELLKCDYIQVDAEMISEGKLKIRRDITMTFYNNRIKILVIIIEAKNVKLTDRSDIEKQMMGYLDKNNFPKDKNVPKFAVALTKYNKIFDYEKPFVSITWRDIVDILYRMLNDTHYTDYADIISDYYRFITGVDKNMRYFEKEVLSVPAGETYELIKKYNIHSCPNRYKYKDSLYIAFREKDGGIMKKLYSIEDVFVINPKNTSQFEMLKELNFKYIDNLIKYIEERKKGFGFEKDEEYRFYILSNNDSINLPHCPRPHKNNTGNWYYKLAEILNGKVEIEVDSVKDRK